VVVATKSDAQGIVIEVDGDGWLAMVKREDSHPFDKGEVSGNGGIIADNARDPPGQRSVRGAGKVGVG